MVEEEQSFNAEKSEEKRAYQEKIEGQLTEWGIKIGELVAKAEKTTGDIKKKLESQIQELRSKEEALQMKLRAFRESGEGGWGEIKAGMDQALTEMKTSFGLVVSNLKAKKAETAEAVAKKKKVYEAKMGVQLKEWDIQVKKLKAKAERSRADLKKKYLEHIKELRGSHRTAKEKLTVFKKSGDEAWGDLKGGVDVAVGEFKKSLRQAVSRFKKK
jgi:hypothetical protein